MHTKISMLVTFLLLFQIGLCQSNDRNELKKFEMEFDKILLDLDSVITNSKEQNETLASHYKFVKKKIANKELPIVYDPALNDDFFGSATFNISVNDTKNISLSYGNFVVDKYKKFPTLVYAIIINTFQSAYDYYNNQQLFLIGMRNPIEKTFFEVDAMTVESIFINVYLKNHPTLGRLEKYLISDLPNGLYGSAMIFKETDLGLLHQMDELKSKNGSSDNLLKEFNKIGTDLISSVTFNADNWTNYRSLISLKTYLFYGSQVIFDIVHLKNGISADLFKLENYPDNLKTINQIQQIFKDNSRFLSYHQDVLKAFGDYYKND